MYYLRTKPAANAIQFTVDKTRLKDTATEKAGKGSEDARGYAETGDGSTAVIEKNMAAIMCSINNKDDCLMCGS